MLILPIYQIFLSKKARNKIKLSRLKEEEICVIDFFYFHYQSKKKYYSNFLLSTIFFVYKTQNVVNGSLIDRKIFTTLRFYEIPFITTTKRKPLIYI